jgi:hypothetical protein
MRIFHHLFAGRRPGHAIGLLTGAAAITLAALPAGAIPTPAATPPPALTVYTTDSSYTGTYPYMLELSGPKPAALRTTARLFQSYVQSFVLDRPSGHVYLRAQSEIEVLDSGLKHPAFAAPQNCNFYMPISHGTLAIGGADTSIYVPDCPPKAAPGSTMLYGYRIGSRTPTFEAAAPLPSEGQQVASVAVDGSGLLWAAWDAEERDGELVAYAPPSAKPVIVITTTTSFKDLVVDRTGALWALQNADPFNPPSKDGTTSKLFLHGKCIVDTHVPSYPTDDVRALLARKIVRGHVVGMLYSSPNTSNGDGNGQIRGFAAGSDGHAYVGYDWGGPNGAGIDVFSSQTGLVCPSTKISLGTLRFPALDTDAAGNLYVGLDQGTRASVPRLLVYKPGGTALIADYPYAYNAFNSLPGTVWVR